MSSISFTTSLTIEIINAKPAYTIANLKSFPIADCTPPPAPILRSHSARKKNEYNPTGECRNDKIAD
jgi:hypothetical protein